jgi:hypothetical protein
MAKSDKSALPERRSLGRLVGAEQRESFSARSKRPNRRVTVHIERKSHRPTDKKTRRETTERPRRNQELTFVLKAEG